MKKANKKGFTIVELVIVISVIAILSAVLIPTFSSVINKAKKSAAEQAARNALITCIAEAEDVSDCDFLFEDKNGKVVVIKDANIIGTFDISKIDEAKKEYVSACENIAVENLTSEQVSKYTFADTVKGELTEITNP